MKTTKLLAALAILIACQNVQADCTSAIPPKPTNLAAHVQSSSTILLTWTPGFVGEGVNIYRYDPAEAMWEHINQGYPNGIYYDNYEIKPSTKYCYYVTGIPKQVCPNPEDNNSPRSNIACATTPVGTCHHSNRRSKPEGYAVWEIHPVMALHVDQ